MPYPPGTMKGWAELRGNRAKKLLLKTDEVEFAKLLEAITNEEKHRVDPIANPDSGKQQFFDVCWAALTKDKEYGVDPAHDMTEPMIANFINDLWNATWGARAAQEYRPCW